MIQQKLSYLLMSLRQGCHLTFFETVFQKQNGLAILVIFGILAIYWAFFHFCGFGLFGKLLMAKFGLFGPGNPGLRLNMRILLSYHSETYHIVTENGLI